jgi:uncharacterized protein (DUF2141 family)
MSVKAVSTLVAVVMTFAVSAVAWAQDAGVINVHLTGLNNDKGLVRVALFSSETTYNASGGEAETAFMKGVTNIKDKQAEYSFANVPVGIYAIKVFHDEDNSGKFYTNVFGIPKVQYGFSNNAHGTFGPASFKVAKFEVSAAPVNMTIKMQHK